ncbi:MAG: ABC transporter permease [Candidatus Bathyarchaeota archaeon]|nr:ABC transporter permease [Candidatus Bathyarchaeota archaeon]
MRIEDILSLSMSILYERRVRAALTILGVMIGPAALVSIVSATRGYMSVISEQLTSLGQNTIVAFPSKDYELSQTDIDRLRRIPGVAYITPFYQSLGEFRKLDGETVRVQLYAIDLTVLMKAIGGLEVEEGSIPPPKAYTSCLIGSELAVSSRSGAKLYGVGSALTVRIPIIESETIKLKISSLRVAGILKPYGTIMIVNPDRSIFLPLDAGPSMLGQRRYTGIFLVAGSPDRVEYIVGRIRDLYGDYLDVISIKQIAKTVDNIMKILDVLLFSTSSISFAVAVTGVMATMFTSVMERTKEIGVMKALGFTNRQVMLLILSESIIIGFIGGIAGVVAGIIGSYMLTNRSLMIMEGIAFTATPIVSVDLVLSAVILSLLVGVIGGLLPALRASKLQPVEALRYE